MPAKSGRTDEDVLGQILDATTAWVRGVWVLGTQYLIDGSTDRGLSETVRFFATLPAAGYQVEYASAGGPDAASPNGGRIQVGEKLYGATFLGGSPPVGGLDMLGIGLFEGEEK